MPWLDPAIEWSWIEPSRAKLFRGFVPRAPALRRHSIDSTKLAMADGTVHEALPASPARRAFSAS